MFNIFRKAAISSRVEETILYECVMDELEQAMKIKGLWGKALANSEGNIQKAESLYMQYRVQNIKDIFTSLKIAYEEMPKDEILTTLSRNTVSPELESKREYKIEEKSSEITKTEEGSSLFLWIFGIAFIGIVINIPNTEKVSEPVEVKPKPIRIQNNNNYQLAVIPTSGEIRQFNSYRSTVPLSIKTSTGTNYFIDIRKDISKAQQVMTVFIKGGDMINIKVPPGLYEIRFASGKEWYGYQHLFGYETSHEKIDSTLNFLEKGSYVTGHTITLNQVLNSKVHRYTIEPKREKRAN